MALLRCAILISLIALPLFACGKEASHPANAPEPPTIRDVTVGAVILADLEEVAEVTGTVKSRTVTTLSSKIVGRILALHVREGSEVQAGQALDRA